jgi:hypothetical protein
MEESMIMDIEPGCITIRDAESILGITEDQQVSPDRAREIAADLEAEGKHTVAAACLCRAANQVEGR